MSQTDEPVGETTPQEELQVWRNAVLIPMNRLVPNDWNPNVEDAEVFNELVREMEMEGWDEPILVVPLGDGQYRIINGEHRYHAAQILGLQEAPCVIKERWDERTQKIKTVRRNVLHGSLNPAKLQRLVGQLAPSPEMLPALRLELGMAEKEFAQKVLRDLRPRDRVVDEALVATRDRLRSSENLAFILSRIFQEYGDDLERSFMFFMYGRKMHLMLEMGPAMRQVVEDAILESREQHRDLNEILGRRWRQSMEAEQEAGPGVGNGGPA
jgi:hypothetical protein